MDILYLLIPVSVLLALLVLLVFAWALRSGQFEKIEAEGGRILLDEHQTRGADAGGRH